jgi:flagellar biosynthesis GTPase FlhF
MKRALSLVLFMALVAGFSASAKAQDASNGSESLNNLRSQLLDAQAREAELEAREHQLDEDLKPENIERSLAGIGSTKPEELRESRRRQLSIERDGVRNQLKLIKTSRERLESVIRTAEAQAYQQSVLNQTLAGKQTWSFGWILGILVTTGLGLGVLVIVAMRRLRRT